MSAPAPWLLASRDDEPVRLTLDGEGPTYLAPYCAEVHGLGYAWLSLADLATLADDAGPDVLQIRDGVPFLIDETEQRTPLEVRGRYAVGPWRWEVAQ